MEKLTNTIKENPVTGKKWDVGNIVVTIVLIGGSVALFNYVLNNASKWYATAKSKVTKPTSVTT